VLHTTTSTTHAYADDRRDAPSAARATHANSPEVDPNQERGIEHRANRPNWPEW
jgi:hypothetical protein